MPPDGKTWDKWQARAAASPVLSRQEWWALLSEEERQFFTELNEQMGPCQFMGARKTT